MTIEAISGHTEEVMCKLLKSLYAAIIITPDMMERVSVELLNVFDGLTLRLNSHYSTEYHIIEVLQNFAV
jgi:hypothetical protein